jgi:hypothetical protein
VLIGEFVRHGLERQFNGLVLPHALHGSTLCDSVNISFTPTVWVERAGRDSARWRRRRAIVVAMHRAEARAGKERFYV